MKILLFGSLAFLGWSAWATHFYICNIKGFCNETETRDAGQGNKVYNNTGDAVKTAPEKVQKIMPGNLLIYFEFDKSDFRSDSLTSGYFARADDYLRQDSGGNVMITGFTDATGTDEYNQALGYRRAQSIQVYFESMGMPANKIRIESKGEKEPRGDNATKAGRSENRRTSIIINN